VLWLALLLPLAQAAASWHAVSHLQLEADADGKQALHATHCDLCLTAAAVHGGVPAGDAPQLQHQALRHAVPLAFASSVWLGEFVRPYESRGPPAFLN
jgi:hypothetical protein